MLLRIGKGYQTPNISFHCIPWHEKNTVGKENRLRNMDVNLDQPQYDIVKYRNSLKFSSHLNFVKPSKIKYSVEEKRILVKSGSIIEEHRFCCFFALCAPICNVVELGL